jgi:predicted NUDIX family NTP pyrophosphohydrolase
MALRPFRAQGKSNRAFGLSFSAGPRILKMQRAFMNRSKTSAGLLMYRLRDGQLEVFLAHPGGPLFAKKDDGYWSIPKGEIESGEDLLAAARREFREETGLEPQGEFVALGSIRQKGGKTVHAWAFPGDTAESRPLRSNLFQLEWPPGSGRVQAFPEIDRVVFFTVAEARNKLKEAQHPFLDRLREALNDASRVHPG